MNDDDIRMAREIVVFIFTFEIFVNVGQSLRRLEIVRIPTRWRLAWDDRQLQMAGSRAVMMESVGAAQVADVVLTIEGHDFQAYAMPGLEYPAGGPDFDVEFIDLAGFECLGILVRVIGRKRGAARGIQGAMRSLRPTHGDLARRRGHIQQLVGGGHFRRHRPHVHDVGDELHVLRGCGAPEFEHHRAGDFHVLFHGGAGIGTRRRVVCMKPPLPNTLVPMPGIDHCGSGETQEVDAGPVGLSQDIIALFLGPPDVVATLRFAAAAHVGMHVHVTPLDPLADMPGFTIAIHAGGGQVDGILDVGR